MVKVNEKYECHIEVTLFLVDQQAISNGLYKIYIYHFVRIVLNEALNWNMFSCKNIEVLTTFM